MATRFCFIDYDREIAIVAELENDGKRKLLGVGRLVADADHTNAEYMANLADKKIADTIKMGGIISGYPNMPSNPHLKADQIVALVAFVRRLSDPNASEVDLTGFMMPQ